MCMRAVQPRPGPPLPPGQGVLRASFIGLRHTIRDIVRLRKTLAFLLLWMVYSDGVYVIGTLGTCCTAFHPHCPRAPARPWHELAHFPRYDAWCALRRWLVCEHGGGVGLHV
ncbi:hypothetical protein EON66_05865 [archaeon]|nr:MAG: hypothetical protein EON66_05865 [archaeon]